MKIKAMDPHGKALMACFQGNENAAVTIRRDDGYGSPMPMRHFFRTPDEFSPIEVAALEACKGYVLDVGAGAGVHSLALQERGLPVTAIDISPQAVSILRQRGVKDVHCADIFTYQGGPYDTLLMMGHGIGLVEDIAGLGHFLAHAHSLLAEGGQILLDSLDVRKTDEPIHLAYQEANRQAGRYFGEIRMQMTYQVVSGPIFGWLHVDPETLAAKAAAHRWSCSILLREENGDYLARLTQK